MMKINTCLQCDLKEMEESFVGVGRQREQALED